MLTLPEILPFFALSLLLAVVGTAQSQCQSGEIREHNYPEQPGWSVQRRHVFDPPFSAKPAMTYGVIFLDGNYFENFRANVSIRSLTRSDVIFKLSTWHDSKLFGLGISWMACESM